MPDCLLAKQVSGFYFGALFFFGLIQGKYMLISELKDMGLIINVLNGRCSLYFMGFLCPKKS
ncbi:hypothetical protein DHD05_19635 [Arenibacter sp. N53]|nr:hypothetical protein [Arenibacter sp. N53]